MEGGAKRVSLVCLCLIRPFSLHVCRRGIYQRYLFCLFSPFFPDNDDDGNDDGRQAD